MPTYAYRCTECEHAFEIQQSFTDDSLSVCPECSGVLRKLFSGVGVVFKGSGFYRTDSRAGSNSSVPAGGGSSSGSGSGSSSGGSSSSDGSSSGGSSSGGSSSGGSSSSGSSSASSKSSSTPAAAPAAS